MAQFLAVTPAAADCASPPNNIVGENCLAGNPQSEWGITGSGDSTIQGFATDISYNAGATAQFKITTAASAYHIDIYRLGYYGGNGARKVATIANTSTTKTNQAACLSDDNTGILDCGNWSVSATWPIPANAVSGIYIARLVREDTNGASHIVFVVRNDASHSDLLFQTSDETWQAYNSYGGNSLYVGAGGRAYKVSYNRPFNTADNNQESWLFGPEIPMVRWLEANGFDVSYFTGMDSDRRGNLIRNHRVFFSVGHDEYWSGGQRANVEAARDANPGVNLAFFSGNEVFWKTRWENNILPGTPTPTNPDTTYNGPTTYRTLVCYKETQSNSKIDPLPGVWTGTWMDPRFGPHDGGRPQNALTGTLYRVNRDGTDTMEVPAEDGKMRFWRNIPSITQLPTGAIATLPNGVLGYEWDEDPDNGLRPAGQIRLSQTVASGQAYLRDYGSTYTSGTATHNMTLHRSGTALVFSAGTIQWTWGLDNNHNSGVRQPSQIPNPDVRMQQATVNLLADMGVQPGSIQAGLAIASASADSTAPTSTITSPSAGPTLPSGTQVTITGTATDGGGGVVGGVEVSLDGGTTWHLAVGRANWFYKWTPTTTGSYTIRSKATDDSLNTESPGGGVTVTVGSAAPIVCPCSFWSPSVAVGSESNDSAVNVGVKFQSDLNGYITALRFYKYADNTGTHTAYLWTAPPTGFGTLLASATFTGESGSGWQEVGLNPPVAITAGTTYIAAYYTPTGNYAQSVSYFNGAGVDSPPLHALAENVQGSNGVFKYGAAGAYPNDTYGYSNYWVDVVFNTSVTDSTPPTITSTSPADGATGASVGQNITATFNEAMDPATINTSTMELRDPSNALVPASVTYSSGSKTATLAPSSSLAFSTTYTAKVKGGSSGVKDVAGNALVADKTWTFTTAPNTGCPCSLWNDSTVGGANSNDPNAINLGMRFRSTLNGYILGVRFYQTAENIQANSTNIGYLYTSSGSLLASATFPSGPSAGWRQANFSSPVAINQDTTYVAAYHTSAGQFSRTDPYFGSEYLNSPLRALANGFDGPNGTWKYGPPAFPTDSGDGPNYWVDVVFDTTTGDHTAPTVTQTSPVDAATVVETNTDVTATFSENVDATTVNTTTFTLRDAANNLVTATVTYDNATFVATLHPTAVLSNFTTYTAKILGGSSGVKDIAGNAMAADKVWSFTTAKPTP
ncbi:MAG: hypothetical protein DMF58_01390, partial [Acidobacteria bacterium]